MNTFIIPAGFQDLMDVHGFVKKEFLLVISAFLALISLFLVPMDTVASYDYPRIMETICTLLFFLLIVAGLKECRALDILARKTLWNLRTTTSLCLVLILLPFFCAMLFSNDVSLLTFVPLTITILCVAEQKRLIPIVIILQTVAANIGSSLTPFGNPHNLYIYNLDDHYGFSLMEYEMALIPIVIVGITAVIAMTMLIPRHDLSVEFGERIELQHRPQFFVILALFAVAIITVLDVIPFYITAVVMVAAFLIMMPRVLMKVDYSILFVFFFLFVFANGITNLDSVHSVLSDLMADNPMITTVAVSQFTSNVPATILLQPFTDDWAAVLVGADIGGFGTPIASMAFVITLRLYLLNKDADLKLYFRTFIIVNIVMLALLIPTYFLFC